MCRTKKNNWGIKKCSKGDCIYCCSSNGIDVGVGCLGQINVMKYLENNCKIAEYCIIPVVGILHCFDCQGRVVQLHFNDSN